MVVAIRYREGEINPANDWRSRYIHLLSAAYVVFPIIVIYRDYHRQLSTLANERSCVNESRKKQHFAFGASSRVLEKILALFTLEMFEIKKEKKNKLAQCY